MIRKLLAVFVLAGGAAAQAMASLADDVQTGGEVRAVADGKNVRLPLLKTDISADIEGDTAAVTVVQTFVNPAPAPLNATYLFPLNKDAAVHAMTMEVGNEIITAKIARSRRPRPFSRALSGRARPPRYSSSTGRICSPRMSPI